ncbi:MAG: putative toxin-antitoxin system toxin component, PIN family [Magnetococcus sp. DMHC-1]|nr:putative toxin-antitoxin system toxin component, PIN family [Magnetococcales bacterium]
MRVVLDTNVLISGLMFPNGIPGKIVAAWQRGDLRMVMNEAMVVEVNKVLAYPKIRHRLQWDDQHIIRFVNVLRNFVEMVAMSSLNIIDLRDSSDAPILAAFFVSGADCLITGDQDLLVLQDQFTILTPVEFWQRHGSGINLHKANRIN